MNWVKYPKLKRKNIITSPVGWEKKKQTKPNKQKVVT